MEGAKMTVQDGLLLDTSHCGLDKNNKTWRGRYAILLFDCLLMFGIYFNIDIPSALQSFLQQSSKEGNCSVTVNGSVSQCCDDCLGLGPDKYNQLYIIYSWTNAILVFPAGIINDKIGNRISCLLSTALSSSGSILFALSVMDGIRGTSPMFYMMMAGRLLIGAGTGASRIVQGRVIAVWFPDKLALATGFVITTLRSGSVLNFFVTSFVADKYGLSAALWIGAATCFTCFMSAIALSSLDWYGSRKFQACEEVSISTVKPQTTVRERIWKFPASFWCVAVMVAAFNSFMVPYITNAGKFIEDKFGYSKTEAAYISGTMYDASLILMPVVGQIVDKFGYRAAVSNTGCLLSIPALLALLLVDISPILVNVLLGVLYAFSVIPLWPSIALLVPLESVGTANGIAWLMLHFSIGMTNFCIGKIRGDTLITDWRDSYQNWVYVFIVLLSHLTVASVTGITLNIVDSKSVISINRRKKKNVPSRLVVNEDNSDEIDVM